VGDGGIFCKAKAELKKVTDSLSSYFVVKDLGELETFVGCMILNNKERDTVYIHQPKLINHFERRVWSIGRITKGFSNTGTTKINGKTSRQRRHIDSSGRTD
jgi:hypothetical protein